MPLSSRRLSQSLLMFQLVSPKRCTSTVVCIRRFVPLRELCYAAAERFRGGGVVNGTAASSSSSTKKQVSCVDSTWGIIESLQTLLVHVYKLQGSHCGSSAATTLSKLYCMHRSRRLHAIEINSLSSTTASSCTSAC
jgi:hypothetical protein